MEEIRHLPKKASGSLSCYTKGIPTRRTKHIALKTESLLVSRVRLANMKKSRVLL